MKNLKKILAVLFAITTLSALFAMTVGAETIKDMSFTAPTNLEKYNQPDVKNPWVAFTGWSDDNGILRGEDWIEYSYAAVVAENSKGELILGEEAKSKLDWHTPEKIYITCSYDRGVYSISDLDENGWENIFFEGAAGIDNKKAEISKTSFEKYNGVDYFRVNCVFNDLQKTTLIAPSQSGDVFFIEYIYNPETNISQKYEQDFWDMLNTVTIAQKTASSSAAAPAQPEPPAAPSDDTIKIYVNGSRVYPDSDPVIVNDRTLVPIRAITEALGFWVDWNGAERSVEVSNEKMSLYMVINSNEMSKFAYDDNGNLLAYDTVYTDVAPQIINDRTYLPLRAVGEGIGATVDWDGTTRSVYITGGSIG